MPGSSFLPLSLGVRRAGPAKMADKEQRKQGGAGLSGPALSSLKKITPDLKNRVLERDGYACRYCGFVSRKYQEVRPMNGDDSNLSESNLVTACVFCHQCFDLESVGAMKSGVLLWLPEIEQADLHHIARAIYVGRISQGPMADASRKALDSLMTRREEAKRRITTDNPYILSMVLRDYISDKSYGERQGKLKGLRLFPLERRMIKEADLEFNQFPQILAYWRSKDGPFGASPPAQWLALYHDFMREAA